MNDRFEFGLALVREAGKVALEYFNARDQLTIQNKGPQDLASEADVNTELLIRERLSKAFPQDAFLGEETQPTEYTAGQGIWVVDPIDGTQPFLLGLPTWCVSIAYVQASDIVIGVIYNPVTDELYSARRGHGATLDDVRMHVSSARHLSEGLTGLGCSSRTSPQDLGSMAEQLLAAGGMFHRVGSGALTLAYVATGQLIGYIETHINAWDCLAAILLVEEAGGRATAFLADHGVTGAGPLVASAPGVFDELCAILPSD